LTGKIRIILVGFHNTVMIILSWSKRIKLASILVRDCNYLCQ
jgi:hypothetical protein